MSHAEEIRFAQENGYQRLGRGIIPTEVAFNEQEKLGYSGDQTRSLIEIEKLEEELSAFSKKIKEQIKAHKEVVHFTANLLDSGIKIVDRELPVFLDVSKNVKHWVDLETGEIVKTASATWEDKQATIFDS